MPRKSIGSYADAAQQQAQPDEPRDPAQERREMIWTALIFIGIASVVVSLL